ncbi:translocation/assembly module TamB domain-containing protein [Aurantiacibacter suaedae]|uniref:translocation/assembly module TamB domain-containing protein n=1 Tax=Aurantiacibacter suaedae TaxID=2545755 RepID=UPI0010F6EC35|nr:translocation/assembly module TamB domain-containing protein [Aurantiacibacter suaedae]
MADEADIPEVENETEVAERRGTPGWHKAARWGAVVLGVIVLLVAAVLIGLDTKAGRQFVAEQVAGLSFENGMEIGIGEIDGSIYGNMVIRDLEIRDPQGVFLSSPEVSVGWRPFAFINNHVDVRVLSSPLITLERLPEFAETPPSDAPLLPDLDIDIGALRVDRLVVEAPVSGERRVAQLSGEAHIADGRAQVTLNGETLAVEGGAAGDKLALVLDAVPEENRLELALDVDAPSGGMIAALVGLDEGLALTAKGAGNWDQWDGQLTADRTDGPVARLDVSARDGLVRVRGPARLAWLFDGATAQLLSPQLNLDLAAQLGERNADVEATVASDAFRLNAQGLVNLADNSFDGLGLDFVLTRPSALAENLSGRGVRAELTLDGPFATPQVAYKLAADRLVLDDMGLVGLAAQGEATVNSEQIMIPVQARAIRVTGLDTVAGGTLEDVRLAGDLAISGPRILSDNMRLRSDRIDAGLIIVADMSTGLYTGAIDGRIDNYRIESVGLFDIRADTDLETEAGGGFAMTGRVNLRSTQLFNEGVRSFLGGNVTAASDVRYGADGVVRLSRLSLRSPDVRISGGSGSWAPDGRISLDAKGTTTAYGDVGVKVTGTIADPDAEITASNPGLGIGLANLRAGVTGAPGGYHLDATGDTDYGPLRADVTLKMGNQLAIEVNDSDLGGIGFSGAIAQSREGPFIGRLNAEGRGLTGIVRLDSAQGVQEALFNLRARNSVLDGPAQLAIGSAKIDGRVVLHDQPHVVAAFDLTRTSFGSFDINAAKGEIDYRGGSGSAKVLAEGTSGVPFRVGMNAQMTPELWRAAIKGRARGVDFATASPARIVPANAENGGEYKLLPTQIDFGNGSVRLAGSYGDGMKLQTRLDRLDLALFNAFAPDLGVAGSATGSLDFSQSSPGAFPDADARLTVNGFSRSTAATVSQPVNINFVGKLEPDGGEARAVIRRRGSVIGRMVASLRPLPPGSGSWMTRLLNAPLGGGVRYDGPADTLFSFAGQTNQTLTGGIGLAVDFAGKVDQPEMSGVIRANSLAYENQTYGTRLTDMAVSARFNGERVELERLEANAGDGTLDATGYLSLASQSGYPMDVAVNLRNAQLASSGNIATSATGNLKLTKAAGQTALVSGQLTLPETRYKIVRQSAAEVPALSGVRFTPPRGPQRVTGDEPAERGPSLFSLIRLDVELDAPRRLYVSGMGLESEWGADLRLTGTSTAPRLSGNVELQRGTLGFAGRSFELQRGNIAFTGGSEINPTLEIQATETIEGVAVNVNIAGRAFDPQITFTSVPSLPQDEVLARVLFGSSISNLSALEAVQLAASLNSLRGSGGGLNPLGTLRSATGIDRLRVLGADDTTGRGTALAAGQYLTDDIYIEFITDAKGFTATQLEVALTRTLSVLSQAGGSGGTNVNLQYSRDY